MKRRSGMALAATLGILSLIAILAVATLSLAGRLLQGSSLAVRDARLDGTASYGIAAALTDWRGRSLGTLALGATSAFAIPVAGSPTSVSVAVTRVAADVFWVVAEAREPDGRARRENLVVRARVPDPFVVVAEDSTNVAALAFLEVDSIAATADRTLPPGSIVDAPSGVVRATGDLTLTGGDGSGILIVEGELIVMGPLFYRGIIIARGGISVTAGGLSVSGVIRSPERTGDLAVEGSAPAIQDVMSQLVMPRPVSGRRWVELY